MKLKILLLTGLMLMLSALLSAATGCDLNDPDRDVKRLFPGSTAYKANYVSISSKGGTVLLAQIEKRLGDKFSGTYETADVPYTMYTIFKDKNIIGYIHGVNQKGQYGGIQVFLATDENGVIRKLYIQKITSPQAKIWRDEAFGKKFSGMTYNDFADYQIGSQIHTFKKIDNPDTKPDEFNRILRAVKKNLILMDEFLWKNKYSGK